MRCFERLGVGLGYRDEFADALEQNRGTVDFLELIGDKCFDCEQMTVAKKLAQKFPVVCHFLSLSLGTAEPLDTDYVSNVCAVLQQLRPKWFSDHLAVTRVQGLDIGHLSPVAFVRETVELVTAKIREVQDRFALPFLLENITYHFPLPGATMNEWEIISEIVEKADCGILLDLTNVLVNSYNNRYDPYEFLRNIPLERVIQIHIAGITMRDGIMIDSHSHAVPNEVYSYLGYVCERSPVAAILLERDRNMPPFSELAQEMQRGRELLLRTSGFR
jgi:uncharacterized protein (UPF0276 family)